MKTKKELDELKEEVNVLSAKLRELSEDELKEVVGGQAVLPLLSLTKDERLTGSMDKYELAT